MVDKLAASLPTTFPQKSSGGHSMDLLNVHRVLSNSINVDERI